ncbi:MAG: dihydrolipoamide acetyltransferase family protein [Luteibaculaceae bacterium]
MASIEILLPKMGESVAEATVVKWLVKEGESVEIDQPIIEIATDKVDSEVPVEQAGIISKLLCQEGDVIEVGKPIAILQTGSGETTVLSSKAEPTQVEVPKEVETFAQNIEQEVNALINNENTVQAYGESNRFYSPLVKNIAAAENISVQELDNIPGSGLEGRVTKEDILAYVEAKKLGKTQSVKNVAPVNGSAVSNKPIMAEPTPQPQTAAKPAVKSGSKIIINPGDEVIEMDRMRKLIAEHMVHSKHTAPHVTSFVEADVTNLVLWREKVKKTFEKREGEKITFTPIFIEAIVKAIKDFPEINISVDGDQIIKRKDINVGMATALPTGNLIVPVIKRADQYNLSGLTKQVNSLADKARNNKLKPEDIQGGTYTITNVGSFGNVLGTPIINQPQVAIMAVGAIKKKPAVIETPAGDAIAIRHMMYLSHSYDHRVVDGALGGRFVRRVADYLEQFDLDREI